MRFEKVCRVVKKLKNATIGAIGSRPAGFNTLRYSEKILLDNGIFTITEDFSEIIGQAKALTDQDAIAAKIKEIADYATVPACVTTEIIDKIARMAIVLDKWGV